MLQKVNLRHTTFVKFNNANIKYSSHINIEKMKIIITSVKRPNQLKEYRTLDILYREETKPSMTQVSKRRIEQQQRRTLSVNGR